MKHLSLAARYRPQKFADVAGQPMAAIALSRAAAEDRVAPAYLLSGTRGVGKTTIARIFAKALNCAHAPGPEPCNDCPQCAHITAGNHVDVSEIDGASNTGVDDVRALRETIGYLPMEGRYKIFIVDEAHMLSKNAFNALLKTLEEPPPHTTFIFATTEVHRFPATIVSRCQHFVFRHLSEPDLSKHLVKILKLEKVDFEDAAVQLLARRAAGSVRDSLSLLDQALALGGANLDAEMVRKALGLAGLDRFDELFSAIAGGACPEVLAVSRQLLQSGVDIGFFGRELAAMLRNLFLLRQSGEKILPVLQDVTEAEKAFLKKYAPRFTPAHLHAAWQMALESQRGMAQSPEPGAALELLLLNLAILPQLLPVGKVKSAPVHDETESASGPSARENFSNGNQNSVPSSAKNRELREPENQNFGKPAGSVRQPSREDWTTFCEFCRSQPGESMPPGDILRMLKARWHEGVLTLSATNHSVWERLEKKRGLLLSALKEYCGGKLPEVKFVEPAPQKSEAEVLSEYAQKPEVRLCAEILGASITKCKEKSS